METHSASATEVSTVRSPGRGTVRRVDISDVPADEVATYVESRFSSNDSEVYVERRGPEAFLVAEE
jgi:hypothetical protein